MAKGGVMESANELPPDEGENEAGELPACACPPRGGECEVECAVRAEMGRESSEREDRRRLTVMGRCWAAAVASSSSEGRRQKISLDVGKEAGGDRRTIRERVDLDSVSQDGILDHVIHLGLYGVGVLSKGMK